MRLVVEPTIREAKEFSVVMGYEAMRIALGLPTKHFRPDDVIEWMRLLAKAERPSSATRLTGR